jgi:Domain of unknown function (DUF1854)
MMVSKSCWAQPFAAEGELREFPPGRIALSTSPGQQLRLTLEGVYSFRAVRLMRCFPISDPGRHISVRCALSDGSPEIGVIRELEELRPADREVAEAHLTGSCLVPSISEVRGLKRDFGFLYWKADTDRGEREFATRDSQDGVTRLDDGGAVVTDTDECRYRIPAPQLLGRATRSLLARYVFL